ncbi:MAG: hypothetical protein JST54_31075 [Deltaproteobacteria bacterium]|nr:hypothetical protein [Deltaproteobacteria bacterium]
MKTLAIVTILFGASAALADEPAPAPVEAAAPAPSSEPTILGVSLKPGLELFGQYDYIDTFNSDGSRNWFSQFDVPRAWGSLDAEKGTVRGRMLIEATRSASDGALLGVAGDSFVMRVREAWAGWRPIPELDAQVGVVPTFAIAELDQAWMTRAVAPSLLETTSLAHAADLGASARFTAPRGYGWAGAAILNGEGYEERELNRGKNLELAAELRPAPDTVAGPLAIFADFENGSQGTARVPVTRLTLALLWQGIRIRAGGTSTLAWGVDGDGAAQSRLYELFVRGEPIPRLIFAARLSRYQRDATVADDRLDSGLASVGFRAADPLELFLVAQRTSPGAAAASALTGNDTFDVRFVAHVVF